MESIAAERPGVVLTDVTMSGKMDGIALRISFAIATRHFRSF